jgi:WD40 repeat protein
MQQVGRGNAMSGALFARIGALAMGAVLLPGAIAEAQEHVRLMPQLGMGPVHTVAISPDGRYLFTGPSARLWDIATGKQIRFFEDSVTSAAFSPDGRTVLTGNSDKKARLWDAATGKLIRSFEGHTGPVNAVAFSPDARLVVTGSGSVLGESHDNSVRIWDAATGRQIRSFIGHGDSVKSVAFSPDGHLILTGGGEFFGHNTDNQGIGSGSPASASEVVIPIPDKKSGGVDVPAGSTADNTVRLWDVATGKEIRSFKGHSNEVKSVAFSPDGRFVLTGSMDGTARMWDASTARQIRSFAGRNQAAVWSVAFAPDGRSVLTASGDGAAQLWDTATGAIIRSFATQHGDVNCAAFSPDGRFVLTAGEGWLGENHTVWDTGSGTGQARLWDTANGSLIRAFEGHTYPVNSLALSSGSHTLLIGSDDRTARLWDITTGAQIRSFAGHPAGVASVALSPDGRLAMTLTTSLGDSAPRLWDAETGLKIRSLDNCICDAAAFSPDGHSVLTGGYSNSASIWNASGKQVRELQGPLPKDPDTTPTPSVRSVAFSPDGHYALTGAGDLMGGQFDNTARLWDAATGQQVRSFEGLKSSINSVAVSPDGRFVLTGSGSVWHTGEPSARLWDAATGKQIRSFEGHKDVVDSVAFSPDGRSVLTASLDGTARLWSPETGQQTLSFEGHNGAVTSAAYSPDGRFVFTASSDTTTRLWDVATGKQLATLLIFEDGGWAVTDAEGRYDSSDPDKTPGLVWITDKLRPIELKQLKDNYYTPNLLASILQAQRLPDVKGLDVVPAPPEVAIASPYRPEDKHLSLSIANQGGGVGRLVISVNDRKVAVLEHPFGEHAANAPEVSVDLSAATLKPGENTISAYAFDAGNQIRSREATATFTVAANSKGLIADTDDAMEADYKPQFYAIIIGTSTFPGNHKMDLLYPAHDAESIKTGLEIGAANLFGKENIHLRLLTTDEKDENEQPRKDNIAAAFADVMKTAKPTDVLLVYLSGHGINLRTEKDSYYYLTTDARGQEIDTNPALRSLSTVSSVELNQWLGAKNMPLKEVLILDTCAAGAANEELLKLVTSRDVPPDQRRAVEFLKEATGTIILMGSAADKVSYEASKYGQGLLTYALLEGMRGRSIDDGSRLNVSRWFQNASEDVPQLALSIGGIQRPVIAAPSGRGFPVALLSPADQTKIPLALIKSQLVHLSCHDADDNDPLGLGAVVREHLRDISHLSARGSENEPPIVYFDDMTDGPADSLVPKIVYSVAGTSVSLRLRIEQAGKILKEDRLSLTSADTNAIASAAAAKLVELAGQIPAESAKQSH